MSSMSLFKLVAQNALSSLLSDQTFSSFVRKLAQFDAFHFETVVYDDFNGIKRPIGVIHKVRLHGEMREVLTYCCHGRRQPGMALFVVGRTGNCADQIALAQDDQHIIPLWLKRLPDEYRTQQMRAAC